MPRPPTHHYHPLVRAVAKALRQRCGVVPGASIVVACSGGADSVALLRACSLLAGRRKWQLKLIVGHVQHHLREEAEDDAHFVEELAEQLSLPYARRDIAPGEMPGNLEANARALRYKALGEIAAEHAAATIATAHHADDQLETLLMRLLRGASVSGLRGIAWEQKTEQKKVSDTFSLFSLTDTFSLIRPMLAIDQREILQFLDQLDQPWREDATNADTGRTRAKLRHDILPLLKQLQPDCTTRALELAEHFGDLHALVQQAADETLGDDDASPGVILSRKHARTMNRAVLTERLRQALLDAGVPADRLSRHALLPVILAAQDRTGGERSFGFANHVAIVITRASIAILKSPA